MKVLSFVILLFVLGCANAVHEQQRNLRGALANRQQSFGTHAPRFWHTAAMEAQKAQAPAAANAGRTRQQWNN